MADTSHRLPLPQVNATHAAVIYEAGATEFAGGIQLQLLAFADLPT